VLRLPSSSSLSLAKAAVYHYYMNTMKGRLIASNYIKQCHLNQNRP
jgi:hypothetical protein